jgi:hypothetical protein
MANPFSKYGKRWCAKGLRLKRGLGYTAIKPIARNKRRTRLGPTAWRCKRSQTVILRTP